jgi:hypothetical protein
MSLVAVAVFTMSGCGTARVAPTASATGESSGSTKVVLARLSVRPDWLFPFAECPADAFPGVETPLNYRRGECADSIGPCLDRCQSDDGTACYVAALRIQILNAPTDYSEALFLKACRLGIASGCTNRAAGILSLETDKPTPWSCVNRTFEAMCQKDDPWACTMWGSSLLHGRGMQPDVARARQVLPRGCRISERDPACVAARSLLAEAASTSI